MINFLCLFKSLNISSYKFIDAINNKFFFIKHISHCGTLDAMAVGLIFCSLSDTNYLINLKKRYLFFIRIGSLYFSTDFDSKNLIDVNINIFYKFFINFINFFKKNIYQIIPFFSAAKHFGYPFYIYSFFDIKVLFRMHLKHIYKIKFLFKIRNFFVLEIICSSGFYVRSLVNEISFLSNFSFTVFKIFRLSIGKYNVINSFMI